MRLTADVLPSPVTMEPPSHDLHTPTAFASPRTPKNTPPNSANRRLVRPLLQQQRKNTLQQQQARHVVCSPRSGLPTQPTSAFARYPEETLADSNGTADFGMTSSTVQNEDTTTTPMTRGDDAAGVDPIDAGPQPHASSAASTGTSHNPAEPDDDDNNNNHGNEKNTRDGDENCAQAELASIPAVHCPPIRPSATGSFTLRATQPYIQRVHASRPGPLLLPRADTPMSLASHPSNLSFSPQANSSASSSFAGTSSASKPANTAEGAIGPKLSSPAPALSGRNFNGVDAATGLSGRPAPPLLRSSLSTHTLGDEAGHSSASSYANRGVSSGPAGVSPRLRLGPTPPHLPSSTASVASNLATPLSSNRSSARPSFLRTVVPASAVSPTESSSLADAQPPLKGASSSNVSGVIAPLQRTGSSSSSGVMRAVNGRVLASPHGARRPELSARRTTFDRTGSTMSFNDGPSSALRKPDGTEAEREVGAEDKENRAIGGQVTPAGERVEAGLTKEMRSFVLGQYRTLQREVLCLPTVTEKAAAPVQTDVTAADFVHVKKNACPHHSKAAKRAAQKKQEEERLRALQQQHHDMEVIRNGGREQVGAHMKSSTMLAGSLSKLRSRHKSGTVASSAERTRNSLDRTISAAFESEVSPFGSPDDVDDTALYGESPFSSTSPEKVTQQPSEAETVKKDGNADSLTADTYAAAAEAWHTSKSFMQARATGPSADGGGAVQSQDRRGGRTVNKNGMKGEAIVVAVMPDSDDDEDSNSSGDGRAPWRTHLIRTKGGGTAVGAVQATSTSVAAGGSAKRAGERLPSQQQQQQRGTTPSSSSLLSHGKVSNGNRDDGSSSSDDDACFSFNKLRSQRLRSNLSLSTSQPLDKKNLSVTQPPPTSTRSPDRVRCGHGKMLSPSKESSSDGSEDDDGDDDGDENACCFCCPCKKPENFFVLCRASSQSGSFLAAAHDTAAAAPVRVRDASPTRPERETAAKATASVEVTTQATNAVVAVTSTSSRRDDSKTASDSRVMLEDLEDVKDDDEPLLSMQSFRRTSIQRVR